MSAFVTPFRVPFSVALSPPSRAPLHPTPRASLPGGSVRRPRPLPDSSLPPPPDDIPAALLVEVKRRVRLRAFTQRVSEALGWPHVRFTGRLLRLSDDVAPSPRPDLFVVAVPPGVVAAARRRARLPTDAPVHTLRLAAEFEVIGEGQERAARSRRLAREEERDILRQMLAWSDRGLSLRTETDWTNGSGPDLFHENLLNHID